MTVSMKQDITLFAKLVALTGSIAGGHFLDMIQEKNQAGSPMTEGDLWWFAAESNNRAYEEDWGHEGIKPTMLYAQSSGEAGRLKPVLIGYASGRLSIEVEWVFGEGITLKIMGDSQALDFRNEAEVFCEADYDELGNFEQWVWDETERVLSGHAREKGLLPT